MENCIVAAPSAAGRDAGTPEERRRWARVQSALPVRLYRKAAGEPHPAVFEGRLRDISAGGLCVVLPRVGAAPLGSITAGRVRMETTGAGPTLHLHFGIQWKRIEPDGSVLFGVCFDTACPEAVLAAESCHLIEVWL